jgi:hypothetical protein
VSSVYIFHSDDFGVLVLGNQTHEALQETVEIRKLGISTHSCVATCIRSGLFDLKD